MFHNKKILVLGAHPDDIELGCGGTLWKIRKENIEVHVFTNALNYVGNTGIVKEFTNSMNHYGLTNKSFLEDFTNMSMWNEYTEVRQKLYDIKQEFKPDIVLCPNPKAFNQDHSCLGYAVLAVFQEQTILFYEDIRGGQLHLPNFYVKLDSDAIMAKLKALNFYSSQNNREYFKPDTSTSFAQMRGIQIFTKYAESFEVGRIVY